MNYKTVSRRGAQLDRAICQALEGRTLFSAFVVHINMEPAGVAVPTGYIADVGKVYANRGNGFSYGWDSDASADSRYHTDGPDLLHDTFIHTQKNGANHSWKIAVPNGTYAVHMVAGDSDYIDSVFKFNANGSLVLSGTPTNANHWVEGSGTVNVTNGFITITNAAGSSNNKIDEIDITQQTTTPPVTPPVVTNAPFHGSPAPVDQPIQAEDYDLGGEGVAYHDTTKGNIGKVYRKDDVDVQAGGSNGFNVGSTYAGEWLKYTISVPTSGLYTISAVADAPANGGKFHVEFDGVNLTGSLSVPNTGDWISWKAVTSGSFNLSAGTHVMRVVMDTNLNGLGAVGNFDYFNVTAVNSTPVNPPPVNPPPVNPPPTGSTPFHGTPALAGQPIEAEDYDLGGEGVAYHDTTKGNATGGYRSDDVDIQASGANGFNVGNTVAGEWLDYTITAPTTGQYIFSARAASPGNGGKFHVEFDGKNLTGSLAVPNSGDWLTWNTVASSAFTLTAGTHMMRVMFDTNLSGMSAVGNFDTFNVTPIVAPSPIQWTAEAASPVKRFEGYARTFDGKLYTFGGYNALINPYAVNSDASLYDPATNKWTSLGQIPVAPTHAGLAQDTANGILYFVGGLQGAYPGVATTQVWKYDMTANTWTAMPPLPLPLAAGDAVLMGDELHYFAGIGSADRFTNVNVHYVLKLGDTTWHTAAAFPLARDHVTAVPLNGKIYVFGGEIGHDTFHLQQTECDVYDPATDTWSLIAAMPLSKSHTESSTFIDGTKVIIAGGQVDNYGATNTIEEYDTATNTWAILGNLPGVLEGTMLQLVGNQLVLTNGYDGTNMQTGTWIANWNP